MKCAALKEFWLQYYASQCLFFFNHKKTTIIMVPPQKKIVGPPQKKITEKNENKLLTTQKNNTIKNKPHQWFKSYSLFNTVLVELHSIWYWLSFIQYGGASSGRVCACSLRSRLVCIQSYISPPGPVTPSASLSPEQNWHQEILWEGSIFLRT